MRWFFSALWLSLFLTACSVTPAPIETIVAVTEIASVTATVLPSSPTPAPTATSIPASPTPTPCDPLTADYCVVAWKFRFQRPILLPGNNGVDLTYLYATTQNGARDPHHGVEFQNAFGTPVYAAGDGEVVFADSDQSVKFSPWTNFYGNVIVIRHDDDFYTLYAHLSNVFVVAGEQIHAGEKIGEVGATGGATGSHLHFELRKGSEYSDYFSTENPELWLLPQPGTGALSITLNMDVQGNVERPLVITRYVDGAVAFRYYISSYTKGFEHNSEDAVLGSLPPGEYKIQFNDVTGLRERHVVVQAGLLTQVVFD